MPLGWRGRRAVVAAVVALATMACAGCAGAGSLVGGGSGTTLTIAIVSNSQMTDAISLAGYFERSHPNDVRWWNTRIAPVIAFVSQVVVLYLLLSQIQFFGTGYGLANWLAPIVLVIFLLGLGGAGMLDEPVEPRGYRLLARVPRLPEPVAHRLVAHFGGLHKLLAASAAELQDVPGVSGPEARRAREGLSRLAEVTLLERYA